MTEEMIVKNHGWNSQGIEPLPDKVAAIQEYPKPTDQHGLRRFLCLVKNDHRFIPNAAETLAPINHLLKPKRKGTST